jgi:hypothetical protein
MDDTGLVTAGCGQRQLQRVCDVFGFHRGAQLPGDDVAREVIEDYSGAINGAPTNIPAADQIEALLSDPTGTDVTIANLTLRPGQVVIFPNGFKDEAPEKGRPDLWGWVNPSDGTPPFKPGVWIKQFEDSGKPYLSGQTQYPIPGKSAADQQPTLDDVIASGKVSKGNRARPPCCRCSPSSHRCWSRRPDRRTVACHRGSHFQSLTPVVCGKSARIAAGGVSV